MSERAEHEEEVVRPAARRQGLIGGTVGTGGDNAEADVEAVQTALQRHGFSPGTIDRRFGSNTLGAIRRFQRGFMRHPDGLVEPGKGTEQHLVATTPPRTTPAREEDDGEEREAPGERDTEIEAATPNAAAQMSRLESTADNVASRRPGGACYRAVKHHITNAGGYGNIRNIYTDRRFASFQGEARNFAECVNQNPARFGLERLGITNPYDAPTGALVVVAAGSPGTHHATAGDITVKGPGDAFYNDGNMSYRGRSAWPPNRGGVLGVYRPAG
jgi:peptidoglycan hydrolase-like protein with peptidoglycan-binding domain